MAIPFSQSLESRHPDLTRLFMLGMLPAALLAIAWGGWFLTTPILIHESSTQVRVSDNTSTSNNFTANGGTMRIQSLKSREIFAVFPEKALGKIVRQQQGYFFPEHREKKQYQRGGIPVTVIKIPRGSYRKTGKFTLLAEYPADQPDPFTDLPLTGGQIRIVVERLTPARMLTRSSGLNKDSGAISFAHRKTAP